MQDEQWKLDAMNIIENVLLFSWKHHFWMKVGILRIWWNRPTKHINDDKNQNSTYFLSHIPLVLIYKHSDWADDLIYSTYVMVHLYILHLYVCLIFIVHIWGDPAWQPEEEEFHQRGETYGAVATSGYLIFCSSLCVQRKRNKWSLQKCVICQFCYLSIFFAHAP